MVECRLWRLKAAPKQKVPQIDVAGECVQGNEGQPPRQFMAIGFE